MSIVTKTGDNGTTGLMFNRRVSKSHPNVEAYGAVDELNAALGLARATAPHDAARDKLLLLQKNLVPLMGELATLKEDLPRYEKGGYSRLTPQAIAALDVMVKEIETRNLASNDWVMPGGNLHAAALDLARTACRRAERRICGLQENGQLHNPDLIIFLNRLSDLLWLLARQAEA
jgi:cob(I)alamin adenosyltransferase